MERAAHGRWYGLTTPALALLSPPLLGKEGNVCLNGPPRPRWRSGTPPNLGGE
jgi:hypothetical protein